MTWRLLGGLACIGWLALSGCSRAPSGPLAQDARPAPERYHRYSLTVTGYNYTDTEIGYFGAAFGPGSNLEVSTPTSGGGGSSCCGTVSTPLSDSSTVPVRWTRDGDTWCRQEVPLKGPIPADAAYLEVHFYRDGHIEVAVTAHASPPRLRLERAHANSRHADERQNVINDAVFSRCKLGD
ncbi:hypothetical protein [Aquabacterium sp.]|uniref:hypothetical protein n=1 Tax=Aquabacterium sp. TaxID=1872578 RepID=UPI0037849A76